MFETSKNRAFKTWLVNTPDPTFEKLEEELYLQKKIDFFQIPHVKGAPLATNRLPIINKLYSAAMDELYHRKGDNRSIEGYLQPHIPSKILSSSILKLLDKCKIDTSRGFKTYKYYAETSKLETDAIILAPYEYNVMISSELPYLIKFKHLGRVKDKHLFILNDKPEPTTLSIPKTLPPCPVLTLKETRKILSEVSSLSMGKGDRHISDSLISPFVGSELFDTGTSVNGIGSSYIDDKHVSEDVRTLTKILNNSSLGLSLEQFGVITYRSGSMAEIEKLRRNPQAIKKLKVLSGDIPSTETVNNFTFSEFRYKSNGINIDSKHELETNTALQHSLAYYSVLKPKSISINQYNEICKTVLKEIDSFKEKNSDNIVSNIINEGLLPRQLGRIASFYKAYDMNNILKLVENAIQIGVASTIYDYHLSDSIRPKHRPKFEAAAETMPPELIHALYDSDRTKESIIRKLITRHDYSEKNAMKLFEEVTFNGTLTTRDNVHYSLQYENNMKFSGD